MQNEKTSFSDLVSVDLDLQRVFTGNVTADAYIIAAANLSPILEVWYEFFRAPSLSEDLILMLSPVVPTREASNVDSLFAMRRASGFFFLLKDSFANAPGYVPPLFPFEFGNGLATNSHPSLLQSSFVNHDNDYGIISNDGVDLRTFGTDGSVFFTSKFTVEFGKNRLTNMANISQNLMAYLKRYANPDRAQPETSYAPLIMADPATELSEGTKIHIMLDLPDSFIRAWSEFDFQILNRADISAETPIRVFINKQT